MSISLTMISNNWSQTSVVKIDSKNAGDSGLQFEEMDANSPSTSNNSTNTVLSVDANGHVILVDDQTSTSGTVYTADNGITLTGTNFQWGGTLTMNTLVPTNGFYFLYGNRADPDKFNIGWNDININSKLNVHSDYNQMGSYTRARNLANHANVTGGHFQASDGATGSVGVYGGATGSTTVKGVVGGAGSSGGGTIPNVAMGVEGFVSGALVDNIAVRGWAIGTSSTNTTAISGWADRPSSNGYGANLFVNSSGNDGYGVKAEASSSTNNGYGAWTKANGAAQGYGIKAESRNATSVGYGVDGLALYTHPTPGPSVINYGVRGYAFNGAASAANYSIYGYQFSTSDPNDWAGYFAGNINVTGAIVNPSDRTLKENITPLNNVLSKIGKIGAYEYNFKGDYIQDYKFDSGKQIGFIAQEIKDVFPHIVKEIKNPGEKDEKGNVITAPMDYLSIEYLEMIPVLFAAIKEQQLQIDALTQSSQSSIGSNNSSSKIENSLSQITNAQIVPNPNEGMFKYEFNSQKEGNCLISILSSKGSLVLSELSFNVDEGFNSIQLNMLQSESPGTYILLFEMNGDTIIEKFIKQ